MRSPTLLLLSRQQSGYCPVIRSHTLLIKRVFFWSTYARAHSHCKTSIHPLTRTHSGDFVANAGRGGEEEGWVSSRARWVNINHCLSALPFLSLYQPPPPFISSYFSSASLIGLCFAQWLAWRMRSDHMDRKLAAHRCLHSQLPSAPVVVQSCTSGRDKHDAFYLLLHARGIRDVPLNTHAKYAFTILGHAQNACRGRLCTSCMHFCT